VSEKEEERRRGGGKTDWCAYFHIATLNKLTPHESTFLFSTMMLTIIK
jgi:hypothetical protein